MIISPVGRILRSNSASKILKIILKPQGALALQGKFKLNLQ